MDKFVQKTVWGMPLSLVYKYIRLKRIKVNRKRAGFSYRLQRGDVVEMYIPEEFHRSQTEASDYTSVVPKIRIAYEDENLLICDKPAGVLVHAGDAGEHDADAVSERETLLFHIKAYLVQSGVYDPGKENSFSPALCNRIDRNTGGLVIAAKNAPALRNMNEEIKRGGVTKKYLCAVHGSFVRKNAVLRAYLRKDPAAKSVSVSDALRPGYKEIVTGYRVMSYNRELDLSLLEVTLHTGRTHQIRAHMAHVGHVLLGDGKYGNNRKDRAMGWDHQALYSYSVAFDPTTDFFQYLHGVTVTAGLGDISFTSLFDLNNS